MSLLDGVAFARTYLPNGWPGIDAALAAMQGNVERSLHDMRVREACTSILHNGHAQGGDRRDEARAIYEFADERLEYRRDQAWLEFIQDPMVMLKHIEDTELQAMRAGQGKGKGWAAGDCDDHAQVIALLGFQVRLDMCFVLVAREERIFQLDMPELLREFMRASELGLPIPIHVYAAMRASKRSEPSRAWLEGDDSAESGLISLDTARPGAAFDEHVPGMVRYVRPAVLTP